VLPFETSSALVADGFYRISRNPMYLGFVLILLGLAVFLRSLSPLLVVPGFAFAIDRRFISVEERMLDAEFGEVWGRYKHTAGRWVTVRLRSTTGLPRSGAQAAAEGRAHSSTTAPGMRENT
jgi:protein-S-isoprenylcysteine O-methyltransferase Ste14